MALYSLFVPAILVCALFIGCAHCKNIQLTPFGEKVKSLIPEETYRKIFTVDASSVGQLEKAIKQASEKYYQILGIPFEKSIQNKLDRENEDLGLSGIDSEVLFHAQTYAISKALRDMGILTDDNINSLAQKFVDELNKAAKNSKGDDVVSTFTAMTTAVANFLKSEGVTSVQSVKQAEKDFAQELKKYGHVKGKGHGLGALLRGALSLNLHIL